MRVLFLSKNTNNVNDSISKKITGEMNALVNLENEVYCFEWKGKHFFLENKSTNSVIKTWKDLCCIKKSLYYHSFYLVRLYQLAIWVFNHSEYDVVYLRNSPFLFFALYLTNRIRKSRTRLILEIPTFPFEEERSREKRFIYKVWFIIQGFIETRIYQNVDMFVICSNEKHDVLYGKPAINLYNGIDLSALKERCPQLKKEEIHLVCLASMCYWQAYDRLILSLSEYTGPNSVYIHMVGPDSDGSLNEWRAMSNELGISKNMVFHGSLYGDELDSLLDKMDVGIGCLGLYRKGSNVSASLKTREYLGRGLPFVIAAEENGVPEDLEFVLKVPNSDEPIDMEEIVRFAVKHKETNLTKEMRRFAKENLSWEKQMENVINKYNKSFKGE